MSYEFYKVLHVLGIGSLFLGFGLIAGLLSGAVPPAKGWRTAAFITHGVGLTVLLVSGFGLAARLGLVRGLPDWIYLKLVIWLALGAAVALISRVPKFRPYTLGLLLGLLGLAATVAVTKPEL